MSDQPPVIAIVDQLIERAALASTGVAVLDVSQLVQLRAALRGAAVGKGIHQLGQRASALARYARSHERVLLAADRVLERNPHIDDRDLPGAVQTQLQLLGYTLSVKTIREHLRDADRIGGLQVKGRDDV
jgi:hypothetical protein